MKKTNSRIQSVLVPAVAIACVVGGGFAIAQTKQLKEPAAPIVQQPEQDDAIAPTPTLPNGSRSYSIVIENSTQPNGKTKQTKKVWQDGQLIEESESELDGDPGDTTITLPNGSISNGDVFQGQDPFFKDFFGDDSATDSPFESIRRMEEQMRRQQERMREQFEALRRQLAAGGMTAVPNQPNAQNGNQLRPLNLGATSKYWLGISVDRVPEILLAQLPLEENKGVLVQFVAPNSPAAKAGINRYDVIVKIGDEETNDPLKLSEQVEKIGEKKVKIQFYRKGELKDAEIEIVKRPERPFGQAAPGSNITVVRPGLIVPDDKDEPEATPEAEGTVEIETDENK